MVKVLVSICFGFCLGVATCVFASEVVSSQVHKVDAAVTAYQK